MSFLGVILDYNDQGGVQGKREGRRSRRTSYVMATTASPRNVVAAAAGTRMDGGDQRLNREAAVSYPVSEDVSSGGRHDEIEEDESEEVESGNRRENTRGSSSLTNAPTAAGEEADKTLLLAATAGVGVGGGRGQPRLHRQAAASSQEVPRLSRLQIPEPMERKNRYVINSFLQIFVVFVHISRDSSNYRVIFRKWAPFSRLENNDDDGSSLLFLIF